MAFQLDFADDFPKLVPDPPQAHVQFAIAWKCINNGDEESPEAGIEVELSDERGPLITTSGRGVAPLQPGATDEDIVDVGAVGRGTGSVTVTILGGPNAIIPIVIV